MKKQELTRFRTLAAGIGDFIRHWGFRRIHGQVWTALYVSAKDLSCVDLVRLLGVSKALVSPALRELETEGLVVQVVGENAKVKRYRAVQDVEAVIKDVLARRERVLLQNIAHGYAELTEGQVPTFLNAQRLLSLGSMIQVGQLGLQLILANTHFGDSDESN